MTKIATRDAYGKALVKLGEINKDVVVLDADLSKSTKTADFQKVYPERFFNLELLSKILWE
jgi:transketolase